MRPALRSVFVLLAGAAQLAHAEPGPVRKPADVDVTDQLVRWAKAVLADKAGDLRAAESQYEHILEQSSSANARWNRADLRRRRENFSGALRDLEDYKALVTSAADRAAADKAIAAIRATPSRLVGQPADPDEAAVVYLDGVRIGVTPMQRELTPGLHTIDLISATHYDQQTVAAEPMKYASVEMRDAQGYGTGGNVVISGSAAFGRLVSWKHEGVAWETPSRKTYPARHYALEIPTTDPALCAPMVFDAPATGIVFVFIQAEPRTGGGCQRVKFISQMVKLP